MRFHPVTVTVTVTRVTVTVTGYLFKQRLLKENEQPIPHPLSPSIPAQFIFHNPQEGWCMDTLQDRDIASVTVTVMVTVTVTVTVTGYCL
jgi:hypothetical protein